MPSFPNSTKALEFFQSKDVINQQKLDDYWQQTSWYSEIIFLLKWLIINGIIIVILLSPAMIYLFFMYDKYHYLWFDIVKLRYLFDGWYCIIQTILVYLLIKNCFYIAPLSILSKYVSRWKIWIICVVFNILIGGSGIMAILYYTLNHTISGPNIFCNASNLIVCDEESWHFLYIHCVYRTIFPLLSIVTYIIYIRYYVYVFQTNAMNYNAMDVDSVASITIEKDISDNIGRTIRFTISLFMLLLLYFIIVGIMAFFNPKNIKRKNAPNVEYGYMIYFVITYLFKTVLKQIARYIDSFMISNIELLKIDPIYYKRHIVSLEYVMEFFLSIFYWLYFKQYLILHTSETNYNEFITTELFHSFSGLMYTITMKTNICFIII